MEGTCGTRLLVKGSEVCGTVCSGVGNLVPDVAGVLILAIGEMVVAESQLRPWCTAKTLVHS